ncbi:unnamed protein product [Rotaria magnacalcarata]|uniref:ABC transporter domain-containing protein n=1 Tax=Rotaria magnacalcarata TaxID=392030 RepID=A0A815P114_9BILA|nr:unnamed protein product [Rotaria magnacalcarata]
MGSVDRLTEPNRPTEAEIGSVGDFSKPRKHVNNLNGPTGCGKSSLLDILADRKDRYGLSGRVLVDGLPRHPSFKYIVGYVVQEDIFTGTLTVRENLLFSANLRLSKTVSTLEKNARVSRIITELGLESCADTRMGTDFLRGVSGGEKKRTCIGMELVLSPKILFLDEPTTGECVYHGPINDIETYFSTLGYQCKLHDNPTDFVLDILIDANRTPETLAKLNDEYKQSSMHIEVLARAQQENNTENQELLQSTIVVEAAQALRTEIFYVSQRTLRNALRNPAMALAQVVVSIMIGFLVGLVFYDLKKTTDPGIQDRLGTIFFIVVNQIFSSMSAIEPLLQERVLFLHEYASGYYRIQTFFIAKLRWKCLSDSNENSCLKGRLSISDTWRTNLNNPPGKLFFLLYKLSTHWGPLLYQSDKPIRYKFVFVDFEIVTSHDVRDIALFHYENGEKAPEIANLLGNKVNRTTIYRWIHQYQQSDSIDVKQKPGWPMFRN